MDGKNHPQTLGLDGLGSRLYHDLPHVPMRVFHVLPGTSKNGTTYELSTWP